MSPIVSEHYDCVIGVDTHAATHAFALITATGAVRDHTVFPVLALIENDQSVSAILTSLACAD